MEPSTAFARTTRGEILDPEHAKIQQKRRRRIRRSGMISSVSAPCSSSSPAAALMKALQLVALLALVVSPKSLLPPAASAFSSKYKPPVKSSLLSKFYNSRRQQQRASSHQTIGTTSSSHGPSSVQGTVSSQSTIRSASSSSSKSQGIASSPKTITTSSTAMNSVASSYYASPPEPATTSSLFFFWQYLPGRRLVRDALWWTRQRIFSSSSRQSDATGQSAGDDASVQSSSPSAYWNTNIQQQSRAAATVSGVVAGAGTDRSTRSASTRSASSLSRPAHIVLMETLEDYQRIVGQEQERLVVVRFYGEYCKACQAMTPAYYKLTRDYYCHGDRRDATQDDQPPRPPPAPQDVVFVDMPVSPRQNAELVHQGLQVKSLPYVHLYHPTQGLVHEGPLLRGQLPPFRQRLQDQLEELTQNRATEQSLSRRILHPDPIDQQDCHCLP